MKEISISLWELSRLDIAMLPKNTEVLQYDTKFNDYVVKTIGYDFISENLLFKYFAFEEPKI